MPTRNSLVESPLVVESGSRKQFYAVSGHNVTKARYITSNDPRGYIPVYEYPLRGQWIMMDTDDGYILWTGIWKALGHSKADIIKFLDSEPEVAPRIRRIRGGYLKIQGTWMPYEVALRLSRRVAWDIRFDLVPLFGPTFPSTCMSPDQPGFGQITHPNGRRRRGGCRPFLSNPSVPAAATFGHLDSKLPALSVGPLSSGKVKTSLRALESPHSVARPPMSSSSRLQNRYVPYSDSSLRSPKPSRSSIPIRNHEVSDPHEIPLQDRPWVRTMRQSWPAISRSSVTLPPIMAFDNVRDERSRDPPSVVLQRLKDDALLPHELHLEDDLYSKPVFCLPLPLAMSGKSPGNNTLPSSPKFPLRICRPVSTSPSPSLSSCTHQIPSPHTDQMGDGDDEQDDYRPSAISQILHHRRRLASIGPGTMHVPAPSSGYTTAHERGTHYLESYDRR